MTTSQITGTVGTVALTSASYTSPVTVTATGVVGDGGISAASDWIVDNYGAVTGSVLGVDLRAGGAIANEIGGAIGGGSAGVYIAEPGTITNGGVIEGTGSYGVGVSLYNGGIIGNEVGGTIAGTYGGVYAQPFGPAAIDNAGLISGSSDAGVRLDGGGSVINEATGTISGYNVGAYIGGSAAATLNNAGTILIGGNGGSGVKLASYDNTLVNTGAITGADIGVAIFDAKYATLENAGTITAMDGPAVYLGAFGTNRLIVDAGAKFGGDVVALEPASNTIELTSGASAGTISGLGVKYENFQTVTIDAGATWTIAGTGTGFAGVTIAGFNTHDAFDLTDIAFTAGDTATVDGTTDVLTIKDSGGATLDTLQLSGNFSAEFFHLADDGTGGMVITEDGTPCYCPGTMILTPGGEVVVEALRIGDLVTVLSGAARPIKWIGHRCYSGRFAQANTEILPIRIEAGALEPGIPHRDLYVSPLHALYLDGILVPAWVLVNGKTIERMGFAERVEYLHIELDTHDVILAEGVPAETFLDEDNRGMFHNAAEFRALYPNGPQGRAQYCAPRLEDGEAVEKILNRLKRSVGLRAA